MSKSRATRDVLSTKEAAEICKVALSTIVYWFDKGMIEGYRTPGGHRRIFRSDLEKFMREHRMPIRHRLDDGLVRILVVSPRPDFFEALRRETRGPNGHVDWRQVASVFEAGLALGLTRPDILVLDTATPGVSGVDVVEALRSDPATREVYVVLVGSNEALAPLEDLAEPGLLDLVLSPAPPEAVGELLARRLYGVASVPS